MKQGIHEKINACATDLEQCMILISAEKMNDDAEDKREKQEDLQRDIRRANFGFICISGNFVKDETTQRSIEGNLVFFKSDRKKEAFEYFTKISCIFGQELFLFVENGKANYVDEKGTILKTEDFYPEKLDKYFAEIKKEKSLPTEITIIKEDMRGRRGLPFRYLIDYKIPKQGMCEPISFHLFKEDVKDRIEQRMEYIIKTAEMSLLYQLSLSSKELFHSNFIYWIGKMYRKEFSDFWKKILKTDDIEIEKVEREKANIDLTIHLKNGKKIIVENKVKSIPTKAQLDEYYTKHKGSYFVLLSVSDNSDIVKGTDWVYVSYKDLEDKFLRKIKPYREYYEDLIDDYCQVINFMTNIFLILNKQYNNSPYLEFIGKAKNTKNQVVEALKEVRFSDAYLKHFAQLMVRNIQNKIEATFKNKKIFIENKIQANDKMSIGDIVLEHNFTNSQPLVSMGVLLSRNENSNLFLAVQLQGIQLRMVVCEDIPKGKKSNLNVFDIAKNLQTSDQWISEESVKKILKVDNASLMGEGKNKEGFNSYKLTFVYKYASLEKAKPEISNEEIENVFIDAIRYIEENKEKLTQIINNEYRK